MLPMIYRAKDIDYFYSVCFNIFVISLLTFIDKYKGVGVPCFVKLYHIDKSGFDYEISHMKQIMLIKLGELSILNYIKWISIIKLLLTLNILF